MNRTALVALSTGTLITSAAAIGLGATRDAATPAMSRVEYAAARDRLDTRHAWSVAECAARPVAQRDACTARADADGDMRAAELELRFRRTPQAAREAQLARIEARYQAVRARCVPLKGYNRDQCLIDAHAVRGRALLESQAPYTVRND